MLDIKDQIREYVYAGASANDGFLSEREIAQHFNLKRNNTREVLLRLEGEGVLRRHPKRGYSYVDYDSTDAATVIVMRYMVEREAVRKAAVRATREDMVRLTLIFEELEALIAAKDLPGFMASDMEFHTALIASSHDNMLIKIFEFMKATLFRRRDLAAGEFPQSFVKTQEAHRKIFAAFKARDAMALEQALYDHIGHHEAIAGLGIPARQG
ncbi:HTH-type transcriptional repressor RspR [bioreactor metagenome]|uniref:HTH-type transcriptional repressor RspR n=1 Tax=bioreactor metagenome TaxID=1076179 RepID=A0A645BB15_9ZZZZ